jgi:hypothetical protein
MQNLLDAIRVSPGAEERGTSLAHERVPELLRVIRRNLSEPENSSARLEKSSARAASGATARLQSGAPDDVSASFDEGSESVGAGRDESPRRLRQEAAYPYGDPLAAEAFERAPRREQASAKQARVSVARSPVATSAQAWPVYRTGRGTAATDPGSEVRNPLSQHLLRWRPRVPHDVGLAVAGVAGSVVIGALVALGYYVLSASNTTHQPPAITGSITEVKTAAAGQNVQKEERKQQPADASWSGQPKSVRTVSIRPEVEAAGTSVAESGTNAGSTSVATPARSNAEERPEVRTTSASATALPVTPRARPNADERPEVRTARGSAAVFTDPQPALSTAPAPRIGTNVEEQKKVRTSAATPQATARNGAIACQAAAASGGYWAWRMIDGRKCWYEGKPGMSKDKLRWVRRAE